MTALIRHLGATDPGLLLAIGIIIGAIIGTVVLAAGMAWDRRPERGAR